MHCSLCKAHKIQLSNIFNNQIIAAFQNFQEASLSRTHRSSQEQAIVRKGSYHALLHSASWWFPITRKLFLSLVDARLSHVLTF